MRISPERSRKIFGNPKPPKIVWEKQFDFFDEDLHRISQLPWHEISDGDLWYYLHDLAYVELQPDLFDYLFPVCLNFWYQSLMRSESAERGDSEFHYALYRGNILEKMTTPPQTQAIYDYFYDGFLDRIEAERGFKYINPSKLAAHAWIQRFNSLGYVSPIIDKIWESWWKLDHPGKCVSAIMYGSGLVYLSGENPIWGVWTPERGGGGPYLSECDSHIYDAPWLDVNLNFLKQQLAVSYIQEKLRFASDLLRLEPEGKIAEQVAFDAMNRSDIIQLRIDDLIDELSKTSLNRNIRHW